MLEMLLVPLVTSAASRIVKHAVGGDDGQEAGALAAELIHAVLAQQESTADAIEGLSAQVADVRESMWTGPFRSAMNQLEDAGRPGLPARQRAALLHSARERFSDAKGFAPDDPSIVATLDIHYALAWIAEGAISRGKDQLARTASRLEEAILVTHAVAANEMKEWTKYQNARARDNELQFAIRYSLGSRFFRPPPDPRDPSGSYSRLLALTKDHDHLQQLRLQLLTSGDEWPVQIVAPSRRLYDGEGAAVVLDQPRHVAGRCFDVTTCVSLAPFGPHRSVQFSVTNGRAYPLGLRVGATVDATPPILDGPAITVAPGATRGSDQLPCAALTEKQSLVIELMITMRDGAARVLVPFAPETNPLTLSFTDRRLLAAARPREEQGE